MSGANNPAPQNPVPQPPPTYDQWLADTLAELGTRDQIRNQPAVALTVQPNRPRLPPAPVGKGGSKAPFSEVLRETAFGSRAMRTTVKPENTSKIADMRREGLAAPVSIQANGRVLAGNFYSAEGHNLKQSNGAPDLTRPAVLLLTGSHGPAEDQGLDLGEFYAKNGASVLSVNYGGFGASANANGSDVTPTEESLYQDAQAMLQHLVDLGYDTDNIIVHGFSLGGAIGGKLKETMEAGGLGATGGDFRGAVMDRPMLSMAHGVLGHTPTPLRKVGLGRVAASYSRQALGKFGARGAIEGNATSGTRTVVTSDEKYFGQKAEELRQALQGQGTRGGAVTGAASNQDHMDHAAMLGVNDAALKQLVQRNRGGQAQNVKSAAPEGAHKISMEIIGEINGKANGLTADANAIRGTVAALQAGTPPAANVITHFINKADGAIQVGLDLARNAPAAYAIWKTQAQTAVQSLQESVIALTEMRAAQGLPAQVPPASVVDASQTQAEAAMAALQAAGGPSPANLAMENEVLKAEAAVRKLAGGAFGQQFLADLTNAHALITARRTAEAQAARARAAQRRQRVAQGLNAVRQFRAQRAAAAANAT
jgi:hypothetical protein